MMVDFSKKKFAVISLGCDKNRVDSEKMLSRIRQRGCEICSDPADAEIIIINTCAFLNAARKEAIDVVLEYAEYKKAKTEKIVVTGCLPEKFIDELYPALTEADVFLGVDDYDCLFDALEISYDEKRANFVKRGHSDIRSDVDRCLTTPSHYAYLKIADGCSNFCTYCLIPKIRGAYRSYSVKSLIEEAKKLGDLSELILVAQDITRYGCDLTDDKSSLLCSLLESLSELDNIGSIRLLYCYPEMIDDRLISEIKNNSKIIKYVDIPFQHSETRILKLMNRQGSRELYASLIRRLRDAIPEISIRSTFMTGFPTETNEEVDALCDFLIENRLTNCGFFAYSREHDTPAYKMSGQIKYGSKISRVKKLYTVQQGISLDFLKGFVGKKISVLCDGIDYEKGCFVGRAYFSAPEIDGNVFFNSAFAEQGRYYDVLITYSTEYDLYGKTEDYIDE